MLVPPLWEWVPLKRIYMGPAYISTNYRESIVKSVLESVSLTILFFRFANVSKVVCYIVKKV